MPQPSIFGFLRDRESQKGVGQGLLDAANRGMVAGALGAPVDMATQAANLGVAGAGYLGHKLGLLSTPFDLIDSKTVPGSSEWIGQKMQNSGMVTESRNPVAEAGMGLLSPVAFKAAQKAGGLLAGAEMKAAENAAKPSTMRAQAQRGAIAWHGPEAKNNMSAPHLQDLVSSQKFIDRDVVARKIREGNFDVRVSPQFEVDGENVRAILDGHHALEAAVRSGNKPNFIEQTPRENDAVQLLKDGSLDDFLQSQWIDSPWYHWATKRDIW